MISKKMFLRARGFAQVMLEQKGTKHLFLQCPSSRSSQMKYLLTYNPEEEDWRDSIKCSCKWSSTYGIDAKTGLLTKPCSHILAGMIFLSRKYGKFKEEVEAMKKESGIE